MAKTEYYEPKLLDGEREQPGILVDAVALLELYLRALPMMNATDRKRYGDRAVSLIIDVIADFQMAYDFEEDRAVYARNLCRSVSKFIFLSRVIGGTNAISIRLAHEKMSPDAMKLEIFSRTAALDEGVTRWRKSLFGPKAKQGHDRARGGAAATQIIKEAPPPTQGG